MKDSERSMRLESIVV